MLGISTLAFALLTAPTPAVARAALPEVVAARLPVTAVAADVVMAPEASVVATPAEAEAPRRAFNYGRAGWQIGAAMGIGVVWYQSQIELNKLDFDFDRTWADQWRRLSTSSGYRFDDNNLTLNVGHAFMGTYYHQFARANGGGMVDALLFDFVTSSVWELAVEHREVVSLNDTVVTSLGGVALGESLFQLGEFFARSRPTLVNRVLMTVFSPSRAVAWLSGDRPMPAQAPEGRFGLAGDADHRFAFALGGAQRLGASGAGADGVVPAGGKPWDANLRVDFELINLPEYGRAATRSRTLHGGEFTRVQVDYVRGNQHLRNLVMNARASMWGRHFQSTEPERTEVAEPSARGDERVTGSAIFVGTASAFDLTFDELGATNDFITAVHILGPAVDATWFRERWTFRAGADLYPDFAMVRPFALRELPGGGVERAGMKSTIPGLDYYYALGVASAARLEASYRKARAGLGMSFSHHDSIEGLDRHQDAYVSPTGIRHEAISKDDDLVDQRLKLRVYSETPLPLSDVTLGVSLDYQRRQGSAEQLQRTGDDLRWGVHAAYAM